MNNENPSTVKIVSWTGLTLFALSLFCAFGMWGCPQYNVYSMKMEGESELAKANFSKQVMVQEAQAKLDSAGKLADAEVARARGVAQANEIIGNSLKNNESYLRYLWITDVAGTNTSKTVVYVPTETNLPILEAVRHVQP